MAKIDIEIDVFSDKEIIDELRSRLLSPYKVTARKAELQKKIQEVLKIQIDPAKKFSLMDTMKIDFLIENIDKISLEKLESLI